METWAVDLADVGAVYPGQGTEVIMVLVGVVLWLAWHVWQLKGESEEFSSDLEKYGSADQIKAALDKHP
ncbi:MAG: hypothetical protein ACE5DS_04865 [Kiloniellaceae bacterium]